MKLAARRCALLLALQPFVLHAAELATPSSPKLAALVLALDSDNRDALPTFWKEVAQVHTPLIEAVPSAPGEMLVTFLWRGRVDRASPDVSVHGQIGETTGAVERNEPFRMQRLPGSDVWYRTFRMPDRARFSYHLSWPLSGKRLGEPASIEFEGVAYDVLVDAANPKRYAMRWSEHEEPIQTSYAEGPQAPPEPYVAERPLVLRGNLDTLDFSSREFGNRRAISIYTPPGAEQGCAACDFLVLFDSAPFLSAVPTPTILDNMQADGALGPIVAVFVGNASATARVTDLAPNPKLSAFLRRELLPWLRERYQFTQDAQRSVIGGSSLGGLAAAYLAFANPDLFGNVISLSGSHWWWPGFAASSDPNTLLNSESGWLTHEYAAVDKLPLRFYMNVGSWEGAVMLLPNRMLRDVLRAKGNTVDYHEFVGGHDYVCWRSALPASLESLLGK